MAGFPIGISKLPGVCFQVRTVTFREGSSPNLTRATNQTLTTFHYTGWLIGILVMVYYNPYITGWYNLLYNPTNQGFFHCSLWWSDVWSKKLPPVDGGSTRAPLSRSLAMTSLEIFFDHCRESTYRIHGCPVGGVGVPIDWDTLQGMDTYPTLGSSENHLQNAIFGGYVSSLEGTANKWEHIVGSIWANIFFVKGIRFGPWLSAVNQWWIGRIPPEWSMDFHYIGCLKRIPI